MSKVAEETHIEKQEVTEKAAPVEKEVPTGFNRVSPNNELVFLTDPFT